MLYIRQDLQPSKFSYEDIVYLILHISFSLALLFLGGDAGWAEAWSLYVYIAAKNVGPG